MKLELYKSGMMDRVELCVNDEITEFMGNQAIERAVEWTRSQINAFVELEKDEAVLTITVEKKVYPK